MARKKRRQALILELVRSGSVGSQKEIVELLEKKGITVSQTTVSRDLRELGLVKARCSDGTMAYRDRASDAAGAAGDTVLSRLAPEMVLKVEASLNLVVVKTSPGSAQGLAWAIDNAGIPGIAGTVAGDDTIIVVCSEGAESREVEKTLMGYATGER